MKKIRTLYAEDFENAIVFDRKTGMPISVARSKERSGVAELCNKACGWYRLTQTEDGMGRPTNPEEWKRDCNDLCLLAPRYIWHFEVEPYHWLLVCFREDK